MRRDQDQLLEEEHHFLSEELELGQEEVLVPGQEDQEVVLQEDLVLEKLEEELVDLPVARLELGLVVPPVEELAPVAREVDPGKFSFFPDLSEIIFKLLSV